MDVDRSALTVLVVEDEWFLRQDLIENLHHADCRVFQAESGEQALTHLPNAEQIDALVTDIRLGGDISGWDVAERFRAANPDIFVVYASGNLGTQGRPVEISPG